MAERQSSRNGKIRTYENSVDENVVLMINNSTKGTKRKSLRVVITHYSRFKKLFYFRQTPLGHILKVVVRHLGRKVMFISVSSVSINGKQAVSEGLHQDMK